MKFQGAVIKEQGITFAIVIVKKQILDSKEQAEQAIRSFESFFPGIPIILMAQDSKGIPTYFGRKDIVNFMSKVPLNAVTWKEYSVL